MCPEWSFKSSNESPKSVDELCTLPSCHASPTSVWSSAYYSLYALHGCCLDATVFKRRMHQFLAISYCQATNIVTNNGHLQCITCNVVLKSIWMQLLLRSYSDKVNQFTLINPSGPLATFMAHLRDSFLLLIKCSVEMLKYFYSRHSWFHLRHS